VKKKQFSSLYYFNCGSGENVTDCTVLNKDYILVLTDKRVYKFNII